MLLSLNRPKPQPKFLPEFRLSKAETTVSLEPIELFCRHDLMQSCPCCFLMEDLSLFIQTCLSESCSGEYSLSEMMGLLDQAWRAQDLLTQMQNQMVGICLNQGSFYLKVLPCSA